MSNLFNDYELLELFGSEPKIVDEEAKIFQYLAQDNYGFSLTLFISVFEEYIVLRLEHESLTNPIFDIEIKDIIKIKGNGEKIIFVYKADGIGEKNAKIYFKPNFTLDVDLL